MIWLISGKSSCYQSLGQAKMKNTFLNTSVITQTSRKSGNSTETNYFQEDIYQ